MHYGIYQNVRNSAWQCLLDFGIDRLPVDLMKITRMAGIRVVRNSAVSILAPSEEGKSFFDGVDWVIVYDDRRPAERSRFTIAHELGHIFLGHELTRLKYADMDEFERSAKSEQQADLFAYRLLCPACVLWGISLRTAQEISQACRVDLSVACVRAARMKQLYKKRMFLSHPLEKRVYERFAPFIEVSHNLGLPSE